MCQPDLCIQKKIFWFEGSFQYTELIQKKKLLENLSEIIVTQYF